MIHVRPFLPAEWSALRAIRLEALATNPGSFSASHQEAESRLDGAWQSLIEAPGSGLFGLFDDERVVGITGVLTSRDDPRTALLVMSFIAPAYRGRGLSRLFYEARLEWVASRSFDRVVVSHRRSNEASRRANQRHGFVPTHTTSRTWPDGVIEDEVFYELRL